MTRPTGRSCFKRFGMVFSIVRASERFACWRYGRSRFGGLFPTMSNVIAEGPTRVDRGSAVLVHGMWSNPDDWAWVRDALAAAGVHVVVPDLPSHRSPVAGLVEDAIEVRRAIQSCPGRVVVAGWSYGGTVGSEATQGEPSVVRLIYVSSLPEPVAEGEVTIPPPDDPHIIVRNGTCVLDNEWWPANEEGLVFPDEVVDHLRRHPRRPASLRAWTAPVTTAAWQSVATTVLVGHDDPLLSADRLEWTRAHVSDFRYLDCDHFILFRAPNAVSDIVLEALNTP